MILVYIIYLVFLSYKDSFPDNYYWDGGMSQDSNQNQKQMTKVFENIKPTESWRIRGVSYAASLNGDALFPPSIKLRGTCIDGKGIWDFLSVSQAAPLDSPFLTTFSV
jgi:hypothetical protein